MVNLSEPVRSHIWHALVRFSSTQLCNVRLHFATDRQTMTSTVSDRCILAHRKVLPCLA